MNGNDYGAERGSTIRGVEPAEQGLALALGVVPLALGNRQCGGRWSAWRTLNCEPLRSAPFTSMRYRLIQPALEVRPSFVQDEFIGETDELVNTRRKAAGKGLHGRRRPGGAARALTTTYRLPPQLDRPPGRASRSRGAIPF
jgi:hypothetical protein